ncbi:MAG: hypothetical protein ACM30H_00765, partial [Clostridia bacterium]
ILEGNHSVQTGGNVTVASPTVNFLVCGSGVTGILCDSSVVPGGAGQSTGGQDLTVTGTLNLLNSGVINVQGGTSTATSAAGAHVTASTINIGTNGGANNPKRLRIQGGINGSSMTNFGYVTTSSTDPNIDLHQADAVIKSTGDINVYLRSDASVADAFGNPTSLELLGGQATANDNGGAIRFVSALAGLQAATNFTAVTDGSIVLQGGTTTLNSASTFGATSAVLLASGLKTITTNNTGSVIIKGGQAVLGTGLTSITGRNALALAQLDPSKLTMNVGGYVVLQGGTGPTGTLTAARIDAGDEIKITVHGLPTNYTYNNTATGNQTLNGNFFMIGGSGSGIFDTNNVPISGLAFPITISATMVSAADAGRSESIVQTGLATFNESLLAYSIFAANEETRSGRIRKGVEGDDSGAAACK